jgi:hypothetical protein
MSEHERWRYVYENDRFFFKSNLGNTMTPRLVAEAINALKAENEQVRKLWAELKAWREQHCDILWQTRMEAEIDDLLKERGV